MEKHVIEIECPDGFIPKYNVQTGKIELIEIVPDIKDRVKTFKDAAKIAGKNEIITSNRSINSLHKLQIILDVLNEGHKFDLTSGKIWYPHVKFFKKDTTSNDAEVIKDFLYKGEVFSLVGGCSSNGSYAGLGRFYSLWLVGSSVADVGFFACKDKETALYVSRQFGQLVFESCFLRHFDDSEFKWL